jgi:hypothetical protein
VGEHECPERGQRSRGMKVWKLCKQAGCIHPEVSG